MLTLENCLYLTYLDDASSVKILHYNIMVYEMHTEFLIKMAYRKQQKLSGRKVLRFIALHPSVGKTFVVFASSVWKVLKKVKIPQENFCDS